MSKISICYPKQDVNTNTNWANVDIKKKAKIKFNTGLSNWRHLRNESVECLWCGYFWRSPERITSHSQKAPLKQLTANGLSDYLFELRLKCSRSTSITDAYLIRVPDFHVNTASKSDSTIFRCAMKLGSFRLKMKCCDVSRSWASSDLSLVRSSSEVNGVIIFIIVDGSKCLFGFCQRKMGHFWANSNVFFQNVCLFVLLYNVAPKLALRRE